MNHGDFGARVGEVLVELVVGSASRNALLHQPVLQMLPQQLVELQLKGVWVGERNRWRRGKMTVIL